MTDDRILKVLFAQLTLVAPEADPQSVDRAADLREELDLDSMDFLRFATGVSKELGVEIPDADARELATLQGAVRYLGERLG